MAQLKGKELKGWTENEVTSMLAMDSGELTSKKHSPGRQGQSFSDGAAQRQRAQ